MNEKQYQAQRLAMLAEAEQLMAGGKTEEATKKMEDIKTMDSQYTAYQAAAENLANLQASAGMRSASPMMGAAMGNSTFTAEGAKEQKPKDIFATDEYAEAFMNFACRGTPVPNVYAGAVKEVLKLSGDVTSLTDVPAVVPTTILREIIRELKVSGNLYAKTRKLNIQGGLEVPILTLIPKATWFREGSTPSQKIGSDENVAFSYYGLECKIAQTLLVNVVTLEMFQELFVQLAVEAMIVAMETAMISGDGSGKFLGVAVDSRVPAANVITVSQEEISSWKAWKKNVFAKMRPRYRRGEFVMAQGTFDTYIDGMVDTTGQPIGRVNYGIADGAPNRFGGKPVEIVEEDIIKSFDTAAVGDVVAVFVDWHNYAINSNMQMRTVKWMNHDDNEVMNKAILFCDGKLLDPYGVLVIKKGASAPGA